jgi:hypothetical protein
MSSQALEQPVKPTAFTSHQPSKVMAALETLLLTLVLPCIGLHLYADPFFLNGGFPWLILIPVLVGLRYGFAYSFASALGITLSIGLAWRLDIIGITSFPTELILGFLTIALLTGEFRDMWARRYNHLKAAYNYQKIRMDEFTRVYHLLKISHSRLEQQLKGSQVSLRTALFQFHQQMVAFKPKEGEPLWGIGQQILQLLSEHGWLRMAALYQVDKNHQITFPAIACLGNPSPVSHNNHLLTETLAQSKATSIHLNEHTSHDEVLAVIPLIDITGRIWGIVTVNDMPFNLFQNSNLKLLSTLGGYIGDLLMGWAESNGEQGAAAHKFKRQLYRSLVELRHNGVPATTVVISSSRKQEALIEWIMTQRRCTDHIWLRHNLSGQPVLLMLLPFTDATETEHFMQRLEFAIKDKYHSSFSEIEIEVQRYPLSAINNVTDLLIQIESKHQIVKEETSNDKAINLLRHIATRKQLRLDVVEQ